MGISRKVAKNTGILIVDRVFSLILGLLAVAVISRHLGVEGFGKYSLIQNFVPFFLLFGDWGINTILVREVAKKRDKAEELIGKVFTLRLALIILGMASCWIVALILRYPSDVTLGILVYSVIILLSPLESYLLIFRIDLRNEFAVIASIISTILFTILVIAGTYLDKGLIFIVSALALKTITRYLIGLFFAGKMVRFCPKIDSRIWKIFIKEAAPLGFAILLGQALTSFGIIALSKLSGVDAVGIYSAAWRLLVIIYFIPLAFMISVFPLMSRYYAKDKQNLKLTYEKAMNYMFMIALPVAVGGSLTASKIIYFIFGQEYLASSLVLQILIWQVVLVFLWIVESHMLIALNKQRTYLFLMILAISFNIPLSIVAIIRAGYIGYAVVSVVTYIIVLMGATLYLYKETGSFLSRAKIIKVIAACGVMALVLVLASDNHLFVLIILGFALYWCVLFLLKGITISEIKLLLKR